ncbi:MAG: alpha/beta fold hydrolase, partial [Catenulispora sp.]|nr:alpha/beta fold hydrolase [Catenulispora sp.]
MSHAPLLILVHSPLVGPSAWRPVAEALNTGGFEARTPSLLGLSAGPGPYAARFAEAVDAKAGAAVTAVAGTEVILVGHSGAGAYLPAIAEAVAASGVGRVTGAAFVDAQLPRPGLSDFDASPPEFAASLTAMARDGLVPPWNEWFPPETLASLVPDDTQREAFLAELH